MVNVLESLITLKWVLDHHLLVLFQGSHLFQYQQLHKCYLGIMLMILNITTTLKHQNQYHSLISFLHINLHLIWIQHDRLRELEGMIKSLISEQEYNEKKKAEILNSIWIEWWSWIMIVSFWVYVTWVHVVCKQHCKSYFLLIILE